MEKHEGIIQYFFDIVKRHQLLLDSFDLFFKFIEIAINSKNLFENHQNIINLENDLKSYMVICLKLNGPGPNYSMKFFSSGKLFQIDDYKILNSYFNVKDVKFITIPDLRNETINVVVSFSKLKNEDGSIIKISALPVKMQFKIEKEKRTHPQ